MEIVEIDCSIIFILGIMFIYENSFKSNCFTLKCNSHEK